MSREYQATVASFPYALPEGMAFPAGPPPNPDGGKALYQTGYGAMQAYTYAEKAWVCVALAEHATDPRGALAALRAVEQIDAVPEFALHRIDPEGGWQAVLAKAKLGDYADLGAVYAGACPA